MTTRSKYKPRHNTPKSQRRREPQRPAPPLGPAGLALLGHRPRHRRRVCASRGQHAITPRERAIRQIARGLGLPPGLIGVGDPSMNHWSGWSALSADSLVATVDEAAADYRRRNQLPDDAPVHVVIPPRRTTPTDKRKRRIFRRRR